MLNAYFCLAMISPQIETHKNRCDGRVFNKTDVTVYCHPDSKAPVLRESNI